MSPKPADRIAKLRRELEDANYRYYVLDDPSVTDAAFDKLLNELKALEKEHPELVTPESPTQRVAGEVRASISKVRHEARMFSLDNAYSTEDMGEFHRRIVDGLKDGDIPAFTVEPKLDGASIEVVYRDGRLAQASTRGDGVEGELHGSSIGSARAKNTCLFQRLGDLRQCRLHVRLPAHPPLSLPYRSLRMASTATMRCPIHRMTGTAIELPSAL